MVDAGPRPPRVLIVSFFYPPFNSIGAVRLSKMSRYLHELGWDVRVLTVKTDDLPTDLPVELDASRILRTTMYDVNALPKALLGRERVRLRGFEPLGRSSVMATLGAAYRDVMNFPDGQIGWYPAAVAAGRTLVRSWIPDVILSSSLPATAHLIGRTIAIESGRPWVAEYRDPWTDSRSHRRLQPLHWLERRVENRVIMDASTIVTVSEAWAATLSARFPLIRVDVVPNGFDAGDYVPGAHPRPDGPLSLLYTGRLYARQDPSPLFRALRSLVADGKLDRSLIRVRFIGRYISSIRDLAHDLGVEDLVEVEGPIPHRASLAAQQEAHALVMFLGTDDDIGWRPAKLYEYLGAGRPILMIGGSPEHEARKILNECRAGVAITDPLAISQQLLAWSRELRATGSVAYSRHTACVERFERRRLAAEMGRVLMSVLGHSDGLAGAQIPT